MDHQDVNRASLKDELPVRHDKVLVDYIAQFPVFTFMDGFVAKTRLNCCQMI